MRRCDSRRTILCCNGLRLAGTCPLVLLTDPEAIPYKSCKCMRCNVIGAPVGLSLAAALLAGCAAAPPGPPTGHVEAPFTKTFDAALRAFAADGVRVERSDREAGRIETDWVERLGESTTGYLFEGHYVERLRFEVALWPVGARTAVAISARAERRAPGGTRAIRRTAVEPPPSVALAVFRHIEVEALK